MQYRTSTTWEIELEQIFYLGPSETITLGLAIDLASVAIQPVLDITFYVVTAGSSLGVSDAKPARNTGHNHTSMNQ